MSGLPNIPSPATWPPLSSLSHTTPQRDRLSGLRHFPAGSPVGPAESGSLSYGLLVHLQLLSTPSREDAVTFGYRPECVYLKRTSTSLAKHAYRRTGPPAARRGHGCGAPRRRARRAHAGVPDEHHPAQAEVVAAEACRPRPGRPRPARGPAGRERRAADVDDHRHQRKRRLPAGRHRHRPGRRQIRGHNTSY